MSGREDGSIPDIVGPELRLLFVGFNPSPRSAETGHHYAGRNNAFWRLLAAAGITPRLLHPEEDRELLKWGIGSTNLVARPTRGSDDLEVAEMRAGLPRLRALVAASRPRIVAFTGKGVYLVAAGRSRAAWGVQPTSVFGAAADVALPSPSGRVRMDFDEKLAHYRSLAELLEPRSLLG